MKRSPETGHRFIFLFIASGKKLNIAKYEENKGGQVFTLVEN